MLRKIHIQIIYIEGRNGNRSDMRIVYLKVWLIYSIKYTKKHKQ